MSKKSCKIPKNGGSLCVRLTEINADFIENYCITNDINKSTLINRMLDHYRTECKLYGNIKTNIKY